MGVGLRGCRPALAGFGFGGWGLGVGVLLHRTYLLISFRESTPPQNRQLDISISNSKQ